MLAFIIRRIISLIPVLIGVSIIVFFFIHLIPGDPVLAILGERATVENVERARHELGLDRPLWEQYFLYVNKIFHGDLGRSIRSNTPVSQELGAKFPATVELSLFALFIALLVGIPAGIISAAKRNSVIDTTVMFGALIGVSMPIFWLGLMLAFLFSVFLKWLPFSGRIDPMITLPIKTNLLLLDSILAGNWEAFKNSLSHLILPSLALSTIPMAIIARMTRSCLLEELSQDYIRTARAKGLKENRVLLRHALKNAFLPVVTTIGLQAGTLLSGAILTETIFSWPGIGRWIYMAIQSRDYPIVQGATLLIALIYVLVNLLVDVSYAFLDPRIRVQ
ncbi:MAG: ABC transporter permease [Caldiserica bacterium]|jgi:peptide/nickel transport system permease protein|nr:ABC transporter permease [Caldisericota bacterium]MDH7562602.1 ABC transporter permease [Caldisericota bacterium]